MKKLFTLFLLFILVTLTASAADEVYYTLQCVKNTKLSGYDDYGDVTINKMTWNTPGNQASWSDYWRIGGKSITNADRIITGKNAMGADISKITVTHQGVSSTKVKINSVTVTVSSDAEFTTNVVNVKVTPTVGNTAGSFDISPTDGKPWSSGAYYKITFNITNEGSNNGLNLNKIEFFKSATSTTPGKPDAPTFDPASGTTFTDALDVSITPAAGCSVKYQINDGEAITSTESPVIVKLSKTTSITAWSVDADGVESMAATATYTKVDPTATNTYTLVTSTKDLVDGAKYVLLTADGNRAASTWDSSKYKITTVEAESAFTLDGTVVTTSGTSVNVLTLAQKKSGWTITDQANKCFSSAGSTDIKNGSGTFTISFDTTDETVKIVGSDTKRLWLFSSSYENVIGNYSKNNATASGYSKLKLYKSNSAVVVKPKAPTFDPVSGTAFDTETATVTITAPAECTLKYTVGSGEEQTSSSNTAEVTVSPTAYTITAKSVDAEGEESNAVTATYTFTPHVKNIAEFLALADKTTAIFDNPVVVLYDYSQPQDGTGCEYIWVKDETGQTNIYLPEAFDGTNHVAHYENGDVIPAGFKATKNLYDVGKFYQAFVDATNKATLQVATLKHLADPVTITFDEFSALGSDDLAKWNNTYVMIPRVNFSQKSVKQYTVSQDGTPATSSVFYNKYSDEGAKKKDGTSAVVVMRDDGATVEYNVYGILQVYNNTWEIMPIRFVEYSAQTVTLKELVELGNVNSTTSTTEYTILNDLRGVRALPGNVILAKDENGNAVDKVTPAGNSFMINAKSKFDDAATEESVNAKAQEDYDQSNWVEIVLPSSVSAADYVDHIITGMTVKGNYTDTTNPRLVATAAPTAGGATGAYTRNAMCPANFMGTSQACNAEQNHGDFFFMTPKPNECVQVVWAVYNSTAKAFYIPAAQGSINSHGFKGAFSIDWAYNADGKITNLTDGNLYQFAAVVKKIEPGPRSPKRKVAYVNNQPLSSDYVVFPLNLDANYVTGITETTGAKTVKSVRYFNIMGVELAEPTAGVNIVLTTYTDGTTHSQKILK